MTERYSAATNTFHTQSNNPIPLSFVSQNSYKIHRLGRTLFYIYTYIYIYIYMYIYLVPADAVPNEPQQSEAIGQRQKKKVHRQAGRCCLADCVVGKKRGRSSGRGGERAEVALIINNPLLRRGCLGLCARTRSRTRFSERAGHTTTVSNLNSQRCNGGTNRPDDDSLAEQNTNWFASLKIARSYKKPMPSFRPRPLRDPVKLKVNGGGISLLVNCFDSRGADNEL